MSSIYSDFLCYESYDLNMTVDGFEQVSNAMKIANKNNPQVYIHVGDQGAIENQVLRIGKAESGAYLRWMSSTNGHKNTFYWSIGESEKYKISNAENFANYLLFFASLVNLMTKLFIHKL